VLSRAFPARRYAEVDSVLVFVTLNIVEEENADPSGHVHTSPVPEIMQRRDQREAAPFAKRTLAGVEEDKMILE
jgi:hypothetical protein